MACYRGYFAPGTRDSVDSSVKYKNDTEGGSKKDIPMKRFLFFSLFFSFLFLSFFFIAIDQTNVNRTYLLFRTTLIDDLEKSNDNFLQFENFFRG